MTFRADSQAFFAPQGKPPILPSGSVVTLDTALATSAPPFVHDFNEALAAHCEFRNQAASNPGFRIIRSNADVTAQTACRVLLGLQHAPEGMTLERMQRMRDEGLGAMAIAYEDDAPYGGGYKCSIGLTKEGRDLILWMAECGVLLDLSHANHQTARDALAFIRNENLPMKPMASHSGCYSVFPHPRNLPDDILIDITAIGGYVGIPLLLPLIAHQKDEPYAAAARHIRHASNVCGGDTIGIGSDLQHIDLSVAEARATFDWLMTKIKPDGAYFPDRPVELIEHGSRMLEVLDMKLVMLLPEEREAAFGDNFRNYLLRAL